VIERDAFRDAMQERRLSGACRRDDQGALAVSDRCNQIDRAANELSATARRTARLEGELPFRIRRWEGVEFGSSRCRRRIVFVDRFDLDDGESSALVATDGRIYQVTLSHAELAHERRRHPGIAGFGQIAIRGAANEAAIA